MNNILQSGCTYEAICDVCAFFANHWKHQWNSYLPQTDPQISEFPLQYNYHRILTRDTPQLVHQSWIKDIF